MDHRIHWWYGIREKTVITPRPKTAHMSCRLRKYVELPYVAYASTEDALYTITTPTAKRMSTASTRVRS